MKENAGDVVKFLGDAVLILWPVEQSAEQGVKDAATLMASLCALQLLRDCGMYDRNQGLKNEVSLRLHCGVAAGEVHCMCFGEGERWEFVVSGDPLKQVGKAEGEAGTGECCLSEEAFAHLHGQLESTRCENGCYKLTGKILGTSSSSQQQQSQPQPQPPAPIVGHTVSQNWEKEGKVLSAWTSGAATSKDTEEKYENSGGNSPGGTNTGSASASQSKENGLNVQPILEEHKSSEGSAGALRSEKATARSTDTERDGSSSPSIKKMHVLRSRSIPTKESKRSRTENNGDSSPVRASSEDLSATREVGTSDDSAAGSRASSLPRVRTSSQSTTVPSQKQSSVSKGLTLTQTTSGDVPISGSIVMKRNSNGSVSGGRTTANPSTASSTLHWFQDPISALLRPRAAAGTGAGLKSDEGGNLITSYAGVSPPAATSYQPAGNNNLSVLVSTGSNSYTLNREAYLLLDGDPYVSKVKEYLNGFLSPAPSRSLYEQQQEMRSPRGSPRNGPVLPTHARRLSNARRIAHSDTGSNVQINPRLGEVLRYFAHDAARSAIENGTSQYLSELRNVTTLFVELLNIDTDLAKGLADRPQKACVAVLTCLQRFGGSLRQYVVDDKGCVIIAAFGLPGSSHEDNCSRAVETAVFIRNMFKEIGVECRQGVAEGRVYCGLVGTADRCEYAMMGCSVNLAARLMGKCQPGEILVNDTVHAVAQSAFVFEALPKVTAKGYSSPVAIFKPEARSLSNGLFGLPSAGDGGFVGRSEEIKIFSAALRKLAAGRKGVQAQLFLLEGLPGVGKTRLVAEVLKMAAAQNVAINTVAGTGSAAHLQSPYHVVRQLLEQIMGLKLGQDLAFNAAEEGPATTGKHESRIVSTPVQRAHSILRQHSMRRAPSMSLRRAAQGIASSGEEDLPGDHFSYRTITDWLSAHAPGGLLEEAKLPYINDAALAQEGEGEAFLRIPQAAPLPTPTSASASGSRQSFSAASFSGVVGVTRASFSAMGGMKNVVSSLGAGSRASSSVLGSTSTQSFYMSGARVPGTEGSLSSLDLLEDLVPLLAGVLQCKFRETAVTQLIRGAQRRRVMETMVVRILLIYLESSCNMIMVDNVQWIDGYSLRILVRLQKAMTSGMFIGTMRPLEALATSETVAGSEAHKRRRLVTAMQSMCTHIKMKPLSAADVKVIIERCVGSALLTSYPEILSYQNVNQLLERAGGSPFHAIVLAQGLRKALLSGKFTGIQDLPAGAHNIIVARFDQLSNTDQAILKTASVIGLKFTYEELRYTLIKMNSDSCVHSLRQGMQKLLESNLIMIDTAAQEDDSHISDIPDIHYMFSDRSVQESVYNLMLGAMKESVHGIVGQYLEGKHKAHGRRLEDIILHYSLSDDLVKKVEYLKFAAEMHQEKFDHQEVFRYFSQLSVLATGVDVEELFRVCCPRMYKENKEGALVLGGGRRGESDAASVRSVASNLDEVNGRNSFRRLSAFHRQWLTSSMISSKAPINEEFLKVIPPDGVEGTIGYLIGQLAISQIM